MKYLIPFIAIVLTAGCGENEMPADDGHDHGSAGAISAEGLSDAARANLGIEIKPAKQQPFSAYESVHAVAELKPAGMQPVTAPVGGRIQSVDISLGAKVAAGQTLVKLIRDPLPRVQLTLTGDLLQPASEDFHATATALRKASSELEIAESELTRIEAFSGGDTPLIPRQRIIDLRYAKTRAAKEVDTLKARLMLHGLAAADIGRLLQGLPVEPGKQRWKVSLVANGLWDARCDTLLAALPEDLRGLPWTYASIGELHAAGLLSEALARWLGSEAAAAQSFIGIAGLMQQGASLEAVRDLYASGAFAEVVQVAAPAHAPDWDVQSIAARPGSRVQAGDTLLDLVDQRTLHLRAHPAGREVALLRKAIANNLTVNARPLVEGTGPALRELVVENLQADAGHGSVSAWVPAPNSALHEAKGFRTWSLQPGTRYVLAIPTERWEKAWVLPTGALVEEGAESIIFVENGDSFDQRKAQVLFRDSVQVVLGPLTDLFPGDPVVTRGAFGLSLALKAGSGNAIDPHAGHNH